jgi:hypothetical protein
LGRRPVVPHRVDAGLEVVGGDREQRDAPLEVVEAGRPGDELQDPIPVDAGPATAAIRANPHVLKYRRSMMTETIMIVIAIG